MADKPFDTKTFAQFLEEQQAPAETVTLAGYVARSPRQGAFLLNSGGQTMELPAEAVKSYKVLSEGPPKLVELEIVAAKIDAGLLTAHPPPGAQPFVLATSHHAPASRIPAQTGVPSAAQIATTAEADETVIPDPPNTAAEGAGENLGPEALIATAAQVQEAQLVYGARLATTQPHTIKELKDPITDPNTWVETIPRGGDGALQEGVAGGGLTTNPVWNLPGMMF